MNKKRLVVLTGAGISAESGIKTFRDSDGLWENHAIEDVATYDAWLRNKQLVLNFYNARRKQLLECKPNNAHTILADLEQFFTVNIITQNVDDLHERAGSSSVLHLHGELLKVRSEYDDQLIYEWKKDLLFTDKCEKGYALRPHIVWFGEQVPMIEKASQIVSKADILVVIGTSLVVYPAASLLNFSDITVPKFVIDPNRPTVYNVQNVHFLEEKATLGTEKLKTILLNEYL